MQYIKFKRFGDAVTVVDNMTITDDQTGSRVHALEINTIGRTFGNSQESDYREIFSHTTSISLWTP